MKKCQLKKNRQSGASVVESMIALIFMCLIFFGAMQLFQWAMARMFCNYASFYAGKAYSLGYAYQTIKKAVRIAAIPISGPDDEKLLNLGKTQLENRLRMYMASGNAGVEYPYWDASGNDPNLIFKLSRDTSRTYGKAEVVLENAPYLSKGFEKFLRMGGRPVNPEGSSKYINHSREWMHERSNE